MIDNQTQFLYGQQHAGNCPQNKIWRRYKDCQKSNLVNIKIHPDNKKKLVLMRTDWRIYVDNDCTSFERDHIEHKNFKHQLQKENTCNIGEDMNGLRYQTCGGILIYKSGYVYHQKFLERQSMQTGFSPGTDNENCTMSNKFCLSVSGLKRLMLVYKRQIPQTDLIDQVGRASFLAYICFRLYESAAVLISHLRGHELRDADGESTKG